MTVSGLLELSDGTELELERTAIAIVRWQIGDRRVVGFGRRQIGNDANVCFETWRATSNGIRVSTEVVRNVRNIRRVIRWGK